MATKRQQARAALLAWKENTTPEQFVAEHQGVVFASCDNSPTLEIVEEHDHALDLIKEQFNSLNRRDELVRAARIVGATNSIHDFYNKVQYESLKSVVHVLKGSIMKHAITLLPQSTPINAFIEDYNFKTYDEIASQNLTRTPLRN